MPSILSHPAVPLAIGLGLGRKLIPRPLLLAGVLLSILPDLDVLAFRLGIPYGDAFGHRGFSHALFSAALLALLAGWYCQRRYPVSFRVACGYLFVAMASHGLLDTLTTGGKGVALLWPFSNERFFAPLQFIQVSPIGAGRFLSARGLTVLISELQWVWLPAIALGLLIACCRRSIHSRSEQNRNRPKPPAADTR
ncbi:metal-dependent hydrolase [Vogesella sp. LIG4]|uniref:metal-dependent hydrolase n=1 Tax=Vogesella sp. LIG4 TaxID=1192162 RepID=UPI00081FEF99|nr:metal-dependent hydrolase [Vogesella sp. LIG4]SCK11186.1 inner membrane protein [Vogesella sp. LIG4]